MSRQVGSRGFLLMVFMIAILGCGKSRPTIERYPVSGKVTLNGQVVHDGEILLTSTDDVASGTESSGMIQDGKYNLMATPGEKQVRIYASQSMGKDQQGMNKIVDIIPPKYNRNTTLTMVVPKEEHTADFDLKSNPDRRKRRKQN